jgi:hypothetical protein
MQIILLLLQQEFELLHKESANNFVFALLQNIQTIQTNFLGHFTYNVCIYAGHIDLNSTDLFDMFTDEV